MKDIQYKEQNKLNIDFETSVFRVFSVDRFIELLADNMNTLVRPKLWDDPFENFIFKQYAISKNGNKVSFEEISKLFYGQCWTLNIKETDALWRIYSKNKNGVRVKTTLNKLYDSFYDYNGISMVSNYIGKVIYETEENIRLFYENPDNLTDILYDRPDIGPIQTLLIKRKEFEHENEVRLIYRSFNQLDDLDSDIYQYPIDSNELIEEVLFDPRFSEKEYGIKTEKIRKLGFTGKIDKSNLYQLPKMNLKINE